MTVSVSLAKLAAAFPRENFTPERLAVYADALSDLDPDEVAVAGRTLLATSRWFPTVAELRETVAERRVRAPSETAALEQVERYVRDGDRPHPIVASALKLVGGSYSWRTNEQPVMLRGQFRSCYRDLRAAAIRDIQTGGLALDAPLRPALPSPSDD